MLSRPDDSCQRSAAGGLRRGVWVKIPLWGAYFRKRSSKGQRYRGAEALGICRRDEPECRRRLTRQHAHIKGRRPWRRGSLCIRKITGPQAAVSSAAVNAKTVRSCAG
jgi:hypothetical protein